MFNKRFICTTNPFKYLIIITLDSATFIPQLRHTCFEVLYVCKSVMVLSFIKRHVIELRSASVVYKLPLASIPKQCGTLRCTGTFAP